jgi:hypothetical protein
MEKISKFEPTYMPKLKEFNMLYEKKDAHKFYDFVENVFEKSGYALGVIKNSKIHHTL